LSINRVEPDLTSFASLLGDSFSSKINLLSQILQNVHYPSLGRYKENLLIKLIRDYIPENYKVASGFVMFVHDATEQRSSKPGFDHLNMGSFTLSKQCDILIYDASSIPVIFKDDDFVILRPESVKAVIEVKSSANKKEIDNILDGFYDFGKKWRECQLFYKDHQPLAKAPSLNAMCWEIPNNKDNKPITNGSLIRKQVAKFYSENIDLNNLMGFPLLDTLYIYNECKISNCVWSDSNSDMKLGYSTDSGQFIRHDKEGNPYRKGDSTISFLLAGLHYAIDEEFNRFYSYADETRESNKVPYKHYGFSAWLTDKKYFRAANFDYVIDDEDNKA